MTKRRFPLVLCLPVSFLALNLACSSEEFVTAKGAALHQAGDCTDLLKQIQADAIAKLDEQIGYYKSGGYYRGGVVGEGDPTNGDGSLGFPSAPSGTGGTTSGVDTGSTDGATSGGDSKGEGDSPSTHSETNTQVLGVDEADVVKTDGKRIYLIHGDEFFLFDSWPADQTRILGSTKIEGSGYELFVEGGKATLFSTVYPSDVPSRGESVSSVKPGIAIDCYDCYGGTPFTKISVFDVQGNAPALEREILVEGTYVSSRRHGDVVRTIVQGGFNAPFLFYPDIQTVDSFGNPLPDFRIDEQLERYRSDVTRDIQATTLDDWIPRRFERRDGKLATLDQECSQYFIPEPGRVANGVSQVVTFDVKKTNDPSVVSILGGADTVYANTEKLVLAQRDYTFNWNEIDETRSALHEFALDGAETTYEASGFVPGYLVNQFSIDERRGAIRVTTTTETITDRTSFAVKTENRVFQLASGEGALKVASKSEAFGKEGERIMATRFVGDRAYVVTYLQTDPLVVVDVASPKSTKVLGELFIPGFSEYMHPIDGTHLLTIGQDGDENGTNGGIALQIFDVSEATKPALTFKESFPNSWSEASYNHKAFTVVPNHFGEGENLLLFPISTYSPIYKSTLEVVKVDVNAGFTKLGSLDHTSLLAKGCAEYYDAYGYCDYGGEEMRRGLTVEDFVYAISYGGLSVYSLSDLSAPLAAPIELPSPNFWNYYGGEGGGVGGSPGIDPVPASGGTSSGGAETGGTSMGGAAPL